MSDQSPKLIPTTLKVTPNATFSQESEAGHMPCDLLSGQMKDLFGQDHAPAKVLAPQESKKGKTTRATSGQYGSGSLTSVALQQSLENRLQTQLPMSGWMKSRQTWKAKITPSGRQYCQLAVSARPTVEIDCGLWLPTIGANEGKGASRNRYRNSPHFRGAKMSEGLRICENDPLYTHPHFAAAVMGYPISWTSCADMVTPLSRKSRQNLSQKASLL
jgi:hypothetical protein